MGGFHGGFSGGGSSGGFHGGASHGGSYSGSGSSSNIVIINGRRYINGRPFYGAYYGTSNGKPITYLEAMLLSLIPFGVGVFCFLCMFTPAVKATVTEANIVKYKNEQYEKYIFTYEYGGKIYEGYGTDDLIYDAESKTYVLDIKEGETYDLYVSFLDGSNYHFESSAVEGIIFSSIFLVTGIVMATSFTITFIKHKKLLESVGDINHDGRIDDADLEYKDAVNKGVAEGIKKASEENTYKENRKIRVCRYCGAELSEAANYCPNCGASSADAIYKNSLDNK